MKCFLLIILFVLTFEGYSQRVVREAESKSFPIDIRIKEKSENEYLVEFDLSRKGIFLHTEKVELIFESGKHKLCTDVRTIASKDKLSISGSFTVSKISVYGTNVRVRVYAPQKMGEVVVSGVYTFIVADYLAEESRKKIKEQLKIEREGVDLIEEKKAP